MFSSSVGTVDLLVQILVLRVVSRPRKAMGCDPIALADSSLALIIGSWRDRTHMINSKHLIMAFLRHTRCKGRQAAAPLSHNALPEQVTCWLSQVWS